MLVPPAERGSSATSRCEPTPISWANPLALPRTITSLSESGRVAFSVCALMACPPTTWHMLAGMPHLKFQFAFSPMGLACKVRPSKIGACCYVAPQRLSSEKLVPGARKPNHTTAYGAGSIGLGVSLWAESASE